MNPQHDLNSDPLCLLEDALAGLPDDAGRMTSARGYLRDIVTAANEAERPRLSRFASALDGLLELVDTQADDDAGKCGEILAFVRDSVDPLRAAVSDEPNADDRINAALEYVQKQWGEYLQLMGSGLSTGTEDSIWANALATNDSDPWAAEDLTRTQTRAEIDRILGSLAGSGRVDEEFVEQFSEFGEPKSPGGDSESKPLGQKSQVADQNTAVGDQNTAVKGRATEAAKPQSANRNPQSAFPDSNEQLFGDTNRRVPQEPPPPVAVEMDAELLEAYLDDASAGVGRLEQLVLAAESGPHDATLHRNMCRELHTLKGASASVGLSDLAAYLHAVEDYIEASKGSAMEIAPMLNSVDAVRRQIAALAGKKSPSPTPVSGGFPTNPEASSTPAPAFDAAGSGQEDSLRVKASRVDRLMDLLAELVILRNQRESRLSRLKLLHSELTRCVTRLRVVSDGVSFGRSVRTPGVSDSQEFGTSQGSENLSQSTSSNQSGSVVEIASDVAEFARTLRDLAEPMEAENVTISQFTRQFRMELIEMRRMPVSGLFQRLNRAARDAARTENRRIDFQLQGEHAGLDRSLQERLYEPLLHMVRNAVSHGIESPEDRRKAGKPETGTITLSAKGSPTTLVIEVADDGRGLDYEAIRRKALDKGLIAVGEAVEESRLSRLIFHPGFSTRQETNAISGRGVGMDVVAAALQRMRAKIDVESRNGQGTTMRLTIPLRSVIEHAMVVRVSGRLYALPMQFVQAARPLQVRSDRLQPSEVRSNRLQSGEVRRDRLQPGEVRSNRLQPGEVRSNRLQPVPGPAKAGHNEPQDMDAAVRQAAEEGIRLRMLLGDDASPPPEQEYMLLLGSGRLSFSAAAASTQNPWDLKKSQSFGSNSGSGMVLIVDDVVGPEEVVVRSLPSLLKSHPILGGVTLSGAGEIVQLLDGQRLLDFATDIAAKRKMVSGNRSQPTEVRSDRLQPVEGTTAAGPDQESNNRRVLVVDDSLSARRRLVQLLKNMGFETTEAGDGLEGIDRFRNGEFRFVFTDLEMPRLDGFGFLSEIRRLSSVPVTIVSSRSESEFRDRATELGANGYLVKPATEPALAELVAELESKCLSEN